MSRTHTLVGLLGQVPFSTDQVDVIGGIVFAKDGTEVGPLLSDNRVLLNGQQRNSIPNTKITVPQIELAMTDGSKPGLVIKRAGLQTANLQEWQAEDGSLLLAIDPEGRISFGGDTQLYRSAEGALTLEGSLHITADLAVSGRFITVPSVVVTLSANDTITPGAAKIKVAGLDGPVILGSVPTVEDGLDGQQLILQGADDARSVTLYDQSMLENSNLELGASARTLGKGDVLTITFDGEDGVWYEISFTDN
ncbi:MAG: hypothetical protein BWY68_00664 [bacterium ADurb.Bin400]|nr:MAG: hypothetical protein BWY68_00664 [bacterium ADurb.Bin400]